MSVKPEGQDDETKVLPGVNMLTMLFIRGKCTEERIPDLLDVMGKVLDEINFDDSQSILQNALKSNLSSKKGSVASRGHSFANQRIRGRYSVRGKSCMYIISFSIQCNAYTPTQSHCPVSTTKQNSSTKSYMAFLA